MVSGLEIRMNRIMNQGRMLCIPMDHGISNGPIPGLEDPHGAIAKCANHGLTSVIINKGVLKSMPKPTRIGILVHFSSSYIALITTKPQGAYRNSRGSCKTWSRWVGILDGLMDL